MNSWRIDKYSLKSYNRARHNGVCQQLGRLSWGDCEFKVRVGNLMRPHLKTIQLKKIKNHKASTIKEK